MIGRVATLIAGGPAAQQRPNFGTLILEATAAANCGVQQPRGSTIWLPKGYGFRSFL
jgi:hypothetical protein